MGLRRLGYKLPIEFEADASLIVQTLQSSKDLEHSLPENVYRAVKKLWAEPKIQEAYERRSEFHLIDCAKYFLDNLDRLNENAYCPTVDDVLRARMETVGVAQIHYSYKDLDFRIFDVGGQKNERRKWIHLFDNVNALFFLAAISEYDQKMREDSETNRLHDAIELFSGIGNNSLFSKVQIILFLNKQDLFAEKILKIPLTACFPSYRYKNDFKNASLYITRKFEKQIKDRTKMIYTHLTTATDTSQLTFLMNSIIDFIIAENFKQTGVL
ncbi:Guanine nucleotide binding protein G(O) subunit [Aphelenchoides bicaudatus]|nr:Guanine nucleotide binding protein G(O) subunit [Aphelenchoides bicaudatus]